MNDTKEMFAAVVAAVFLLVLPLGGCAQSTPTNSVLESVKGQVVALEKSLPAECKTATIKAQIEAIRTQTDAVATVCKTEKDALEQSRDKWMVAFFAVVAALGLLITKRILKYV